MKELIKKVQEWANDKGLNKPEQIRNQFLKVMSEHGETCDAILHLEKNGNADLIDGFGDIIVTLIVICNMKGIEFNSLNTSAKFDYRFNPDIYFGNLLYELYSLNKAVFNESSDETFMHRCNEVCTELYSYINHYGFTPEQCLAAAYDEIKGRTGTLVNGTFIKDEVKETPQVVDLSELKEGDSVEFRDGTLGKIEYLKNTAPTHEYDKQTIKIRFYPFVYPQFYDKNGNLEDNKLSDMDIVRIIKA